MNKRLRKKKRVGEFRELGFRVQFETPGLSDDQKLALCDRWLEEAIEGHGLICGGAFGPSEWEGFVQLNQRGSATEEHRQSIQKWLESRADVKKVQIGPLVDAWYGPFDAYRGK